MDCSRFQLDLGYGWSALSACRTAFGFAWHFFSDGDTPVDVTHSVVDLTGLEGICGQARGAVLCD